MGKYFNILWILTPTIFLSLVAKSQGISLSKVIQMTKGEGSEIRARWVSCILEENSFTKDTIQFCYSLKKPDPKYCEYFVTWTFIDSSNLVSAINHINYVGISPDNNYDYKIVESKNSCIEINLYRRSQITKYKIISIYDTIKLNTTDRCLGITLAKIK